MINKKVMVLSKLCDLPNIGKVLEEELIQAGINTPEELKKAGSKEVFIRIKTFDNTACLSKLNALEGAVQGVRWHNLSEDTKKELKSFFNSVSSK